MLVMLALRQWIRHQWPLQRRLMLMMLACRLWNGEWTQEGRLMDLMLALTPRNRHQWPRERRLMLMMLACRLRNRGKRTKEGRLILVMLVWNRQQ